MNTHDAKTCTLGYHGNHASVSEMCPVYLEKRRERQRVAFAKRNWVIREEQRNNWNRLRRAMRLRKHGT